jgi:hypothetical protein
MVFSMASRFVYQAAQIAVTQGLVEGYRPNRYGSAGGVNANITINAGYWTMEGRRSINYQTGALTNVSGLVIVKVNCMTMTPPDATLNSNITIGNAANTSALGLLNGTYSGF